MQYVIIIVGWTDGKTTLLGAYPTIAQYTGQLELLIDISFRDMPNVVLPTGCGHQAHCLQA
jgi:hypothetical protein